MRARVAAVTSKPKGIGPGRTPDPEIVGERNVNICILRMSSAPEPLSRKFQKPCALKEFKELMTRMHMQ